MIGWIIERGILARGGYVGMLGGIVIAVPTIFGQSTPVDNQSFAVASIRLVHPDTIQSSFRSTPHGGIQATNVTLNLLIQMAYGVMPEQVSGGPRWADSEQYDVNAKGPDEPLGGSDPNLSREQLVLTRLKMLLADRFQLRVRRESRQMAGYALVIAKGGPKFGQTQHSEERIRQTRLGEIIGEDASIDILTKVIHAHVEQNVIDVTGLKGRYDFSLHWAQDIPGAGPNDSTPGRGQSFTGSGGPSIFTALEEQLGLKLQAQKVPTDVIIIENAERPTPN